MEHRDCKFAQYCDGCLKRTNKLLFKNGQWLCRPCYENGTPLEKLSNKKK